MYKLSFVIDHPAISIIALLLGLAVFAVSVIRSR